MQIDSSGQFGRKKRSFVHIQENVLPNKTTNIGERNRRGVEVGNECERYHQESEGKITTSRIYPAPQNRQGRQKPLNRVRQKQQGL